MNRITVREWDYTCGDGCCYSYGTDLMINDKVIATYQDVNMQLIEDLLGTFGIEYEIEYIDDTE